MKFLLTSAGITNTSIDNALVDLLGKPIAESDALCIPTGVQPFRRSRLRGAVEAVHPQPGSKRIGLVERQRALGWASVP